MPFYALTCEKCHLTEEVFEPLARGPQKEYWCIGWGSMKHPLVKMERNWQAEAGVHKPNSTWPMVIKHFDGTPVVVNSSSERDQLAKQGGLTPRDDAAFEESELTFQQIGTRSYTTILNGREIKIEKPVRGWVQKEGSGLGNKRSWVGIPKLATASKEEVEKFFSGR